LIVATKAESEIIPALRLGGAEYLSRAQFAALTDRSERQLREWELAGYGVRPTRIGRTPYYNVAAVLDWLENGGGDGRRGPGRPRSLSERAQR
jgi:hypothetical protein